MRKVLFFILLLVHSLFADVTWYDYDKAVSLKSDKIMMIMLSKEDCPACRYMSEVVLKDKNIQTQVSQNFIAVHLDVDLDFYPEKFAHIGTPTFYFISPKGKILFKFMGALNTKDFSNRLDKVIDLE